MTTIPLTVTVRWICDDPEWGRASSVESNDYVADLVSRINDDSLLYARQTKGQPYEHKHVPLVLESLNDLIDAMSGFDEFLGLETEEQRDKRRTEEERKDLESYVSNLCARKGLDAQDVGAVLTALSYEIDRADSDREGLREDGLCATSYGIGGGQAALDEWYSMSDECGSRADKAWRATEWLAKTCPLAYAQWSETPNEEN